MNMLDQITDEMWAIKYSQAFFLGFFAKHYPEIWRKNFFAGGPA